MPRRYVPLIVVNAGYLLAAGIAALITGNREFIFYFFIMLATIALVLWAHARIRFTLALLWALTTWGLLHMAGGTIAIPSSWPHPDDAKPVLYSLWLIPGALKFDQFVHAYGFCTATLACWQTLRGFLGREPERRPATIILTVLAGLGLGALNEVVEFIAVLTIPDTNVGGYINTGWDLVANSVGALVAAGIILLRSPRP